MGKGYDLFLSEHSNAANGVTRGTEVWDSVEKPNKGLATKICTETARLFGHNNRGVKYKAGQPGYNWYGVLKFNGAKSAMIIENGFHDNSQDCNFFKNNHRRIAETQARVIAEHYGLKRKVIAKPIPTPVINKNPSSWAKQSWDWATNQKFLDGTRPREDITREEFVTVVKRVVDKK